SVCCRLQAVLPAPAEPAAQASRDARQTKKGDRIVTIGGLHAVILDVDGEVLSLELAPNLRVKADRGAVSYLRNKKREEQPAQLSTTPPATATTRPPG